MLNTPDLHIILACIDERRQLEACDLHGMLSVQACILGAELAQGRPQLLLSCALALQPRQTLQLRIKGEQHDMLCDVSCLSRQHGLIQCEITRCHWTSNRRWQNRLTFAAYKGPSVRLPQISSAHAKGHLRNITTRGLAVDFWAKQLTSTPANRSWHKLELNFNDNFCLHLHCQLLERKSEHQPGFHQRLRFLIDQQQGLQISQLHALLASIEDKPQRVMAA